MVTLAAVTGSLPSCGPVDMVHIENSAMAVDASFPVCGSREVGKNQLHYYSIIMDEFVNHISVSWM